MKTLIIRLGFMMALAPLSACLGHHDESPSFEIDPGPIGGHCEHEEFLGTCTINDEDDLVFQENVAGSEVLNTNSVDFVEELLRAGSAVPCTLFCATRGTCGPCGVDVHMSQEGYSCGPALWDTCRVFWRQGGWTN
jgi:hypothetical protein